MVESQLPQFLHLLLSSIPCDPFHLWFEIIVNQRLLLYEIIACKDRQRRPKLHLLCLGRANHGEVAM